MKIFQSFLAWALTISVANAQLIQTGEGSSLASNFENLYNLSLRVLPVIVLIILIYAGYLYISSLGNESRVGEAKAWITAGITGLVILLIIPLILMLLGLGNSGN